MNTTYIDIWNETIKIRDNKNKSKEVCDMADMLLKQMNTAAGKIILKNEVENFIRNNK